MNEPTSTEPTPDDDQSTDEERAAEDELRADAVADRLAGRLADDAVEVDVVGDTDVQLEDGQIAYECNAWAVESRELLDSLLNTKEIPHAWQGTTVTVREEDEDAVDDLIDDVLASARPALDPSVPKLVYEVGSWPVALQTELADGLTVDDIPYEWDENGDLVVRESDEELVAAVLEELPDPDDEGVSSDDGVALHELLDKVFMSSDRLAKHATDPAATVTLVESVAVLEQVALPFGFEPAQWRRLVGEITNLRDAIEPPLDDEGTPLDGPAATDAEIAAAAATVRDQIRQYI